MVCDAELKIGIVDAHSKTAYCVSYWVLEGHKMGRRCHAWVHSCITTNRIEKGKEERWNDNVWTRLLRLEQLNINVVFPEAQQPKSGQGLLILEASQSHSDTQHSAELPWTSDQPDVETSTWQHTTLKRDRHPCPRRDSNPQSQQAKGGRPTP
jgi:hypothetical protein